MLCLLLKALLVLHFKLALYYVQQSGAASQRSVQTCLPHACVVTRVEGVGSSRTGLRLLVHLGLGDILL